MNSKLCHSARRKLPGCVGSCQVQKALGLHRFWAPEQEQLGFIISFVAGHDPAGKPLFAPGGWVGITVDPKDR